MKYYLILALLLCPLSANAITSGITGTTACAAATTSCVMPATKVGDFIYVFAFRSATTAPSLPAGFTTVATASANNSSFRSGCKIALTTSEASGTWTNATSITVTIYRGIRNGLTTATCVSGGIGGNTNSSGTTSTITYGTITMTVSDGSSWVVGASGNSVGTCTPALMSSRTAQTTVNITNDTNAGATSWSSTNCTGSTGNWKSNVIEILAAVNNCAGSSVVVQCASCVGGTTTTYCGLTSPVTAGNMIAMVTGTSDGKTITTPTDLLGQTLLLAVAQSVASTGRLNIHYFMNSAAGSETGYCIISATDDNHCRIYEVSGIATTSALDQTGTGTGTASAQTVVSAGSTAVNSEFILAAFYDNNHGTGYTAGTGYTDGLSTTGGGGDAMGTESTKTNTAGSQTAPMTNNFGSTSFVSAMATFKPPAAGGTIYHRLPLLGVGD